MKGFLHWLGFHDWSAWGAGYSSKDENGNINLSGLDINGHPYQSRYCRNMNCHKVEVRAILV